MATKLFVAIIGIATIVYYMFGDRLSSGVGEWQYIHQYNGKVLDKLIIYPNNKAIYFGRTCKWGAVGGNKLLIECGNSAHQLALIAENKAELDGGMVYRKGHVPSEEVSKIIVKRMMEQSHFQGSGQIELKGPGSD